MATLRAATEAQTNLERSPTSPTNGLRAHYPLRSLSAMAVLSANRRGPDKLRAHGPTIDGPRSMLPAAAIAAAPGEFNALSPTRRTSPAMTNDRVSPFSPGAECRRNGSAIRRSVSCGLLDKWNLRSILRTGYRRCPTFRLKTDFPDKSCNDRLVKAACPAHGFCINL